MMNPFDVFNKRHPFYHWIKFNIYKKIRNPICEVGFHYDIPDEENSKIRAEWIKRIKAGKEKSYWEKNFWKR